MRIKTLNIAINKKSNIPYGATLAPPPQKKSLSALKLEKPYKGLLQIVNTNNLRSNTIKLNKFRRTLHFTSPHNIKSSFPTIHNSRAS